MYCGKKQEGLLLRWCGIAHESNCDFSMMSKFIVDKVQATNFDDSDTYSLFFLMYVESRF
jgi:hypothetical protein